MKLVLEFDDLNPNPEVDCINEIEKLISIYPNIKLTFFVPAVYKGWALFQYPEWVKTIKQFVDNKNVELCVHGLFHTQEEFKNLSEDLANETLNTAEETFDFANIPFQKIFRGPNWGNSENTYRALIKRNYSSVWTHEDYKWLADKFPEIRSVYYNWNLKDKFEESGVTNEGIIIAHGHSHSVCSNGIGESFDRICDMINKYNPEFLFASEV